MSESYLPSPRRFFDEAEWDRFMELSETQATAEVDAADREFSEWLSKLSPLESYRYWRRFTLISIMENRRRLRDPKLARVAIIDQIWRDAIKRSQRNLLKRRHHLQTGVWPGEA